MTLGTPPLIALPDQVAETVAWPALAKAIHESPDALTLMERRWLSVALAHRSYLYEHSADFPGVGAGCLSLLEGTGKSVLDLELRTAIAESAPLSTVGRRNDEVARVIAPMRAAIVSSLDIAQWAQLGKGEAKVIQDRLGGGQHVRSYDAVALQLLGWWTLTKSARRLRELIVALYRQVAAVVPAGAVEWRTLVDKHFGKRHPQFCIVAEGPDHSRTFRAILSTDDGRTGSGEARTKKEAQQIAARDYLQGNAPHLLATTTVPERIAPRNRLTVAGEDPRILRHIATAFGCADLGPFRQALTHRSWVYENMPGGDVERDSNATLAHLGSAVLGACVARARARAILAKTTDPDADLAIVLTLPDRVLVPLFEALGLPRALRLGAGQRTKPVTVEMAANAVQAVLAASYLQHPDLPTFESDLPDAVTRFLRAQVGRAHLDPTTQLQALAVELGVEVTHAYADTGPDHNKAYHATLTLIADAEVVEVSGSGSGRVEARKSAAAVVMAAAECLVAASPAGVRHDIARFLLRRQLEVLPASERHWREWQRKGRLATALVRAGDWSRYDGWARTTVELLGRDYEPTEEVLRGLGNFYGQLARGRGGRPNFTAALADVLAWVRTAADDDMTTLLADGPWRKLLGLSTAQAVWLRSDDVSDAAAVVDDWALLNRRRLRVNFETERTPCPVSARAAAAMLRCLQECAAHLVSTPDGRQPEVVVRSRRDTVAYHLELMSSAGWGEDLAESPLLRLVCEAAAPGITVHVSNAHRVTIIVRVQPAAETSTWLSVLGRSRRPDDYEAELGRILHDLKNEITAARVALASKPKTRTEQLAAQLATSKHLDAAQMLATRLANADMLYAVADLDGITDVPRLMRGYLSDLLRTLPRDIRLVPPADSDVVVAIEERALRAVLDNLVKNAVEAMPAGGEIRVDYAAADTDGMALLEVADNGPGIPSHVMEALHRGTAVASSKRQGSGLGLAGVQRVLRRAGGSLEPLLQADGHGWLLTLPLATSDEGGPTGW